MNLKERGITVGDLLIVIIIILTFTTVIKTFNKDKKMTPNSSYQSNNSFDISLLSNKNLIHSKL